MALAGTRCVFGGRKGALPGGIFVLGAVVLTCGLAGCDVFCQLFGDVFPEFCPDKYALTVSVTGEGTVALDPSGGSYDFDTTVTLDPTPSDGWRFVQWEGDLGGSTDPATITMDDNKSVRAVFEQNGTPASYVLIVDANSCCAVQLDPAGGVYDAGTEVTLTAVSTACCTFDHWEGNLTGSTNPATLTMDADKSVKAVCTETGPFTLATAVTGQGTVTVDPEQDTYDCGAEVALTAVPGDGWQFNKWQGGQTGSTNPAIVSMDADKNVTAVFTQEPQGSIESGQTVSGSIDAPSEQDIWTFHGVAGQRVRIVETVTGGDLHTSIFLYPPGGGPAEAQDGCFFCDTATIDTQLDETGIYTIIVEDNEKTETGQYRLTFINLSGTLTSPQDPDGGAISSGQTASGTIDVASDMDAFTFHGVAGQRVRIVETVTAGDLHTSIFLYPPGGGPAEAQDGCFFCDTATIDTQLDETGTYTIIVEDNQSSDSGDYNLALQLF